MSTFRPGLQRGVIFNYVLVYLCLSWIHRGIPTSEAFSLTSYDSGFYRRRYYRTGLALSSPNVKENKQSDERPLLRTLSLVDEATGEILAQGYELEPLPEERDKPDEDDLEYLYPTQRQYFQFAPAPAPPRAEDGDNVESLVPPSPVQQVRTTSFGCGKLGHQVWSSSTALCLSLVHDYYNDANAQDSSSSSVRSPQSVLELGAGCGLPSIVCRDVLQIPTVVATDFWYVGEDSEREKERLVPETWHGINLEYNVVQGQTKEGGALVKRLDWHDLETVRQAAGPSVDLVIGSDLIYYPMDIQPLWNTIETLLQDCGASKVVLLSPLKPETREAFPAFLELLNSKSNSERTGANYLLERQKLCLYKRIEDLNARQDGDRFLKLTLTLNKSSQTA
jgi:predicted nicotinamide N-methyase